MKSATYKIRGLAWGLSLALGLTAACGPQASGHTESTTTPTHSTTSQTTEPITTLPATEDQELQRYNASFLQLFDTLTQVIGYAEDEDSFRQQVADLKQDLQEYHELYDIFQEYEGVTNFKTINDHAGQGPLEVDERIIDLLELSLEMYDATDGMFNIAIGSVLELWHDAREHAGYNPEDAYVPDLEALQAANKHTSIDDLIIDREALTVELLDPEMSLDVGAIAKGYAVEQAALLAEARGVEHMLISVGGNVRAIGGRGSLSEPWRVSFRNPNEAEQEDKPNLTILNLTQASLVTSGVYERYYMIDGERYHHIIDPVSLVPENHYLSVSIVTPDSGLADAITTALFNWTVEEGLAFIETMDDTEAIWVLNDGPEITSPGFRALEAN